MADPIADNAELAVDELKRKARRRLIGAIVLALAAATLLPLLLEQEQKPLGDDVSVQIPPVDEGRFVSRLTGDKGKEAQGDAKADNKVAGKIDTAPAQKDDARPEPKAEAAPGPKADASQTADAKPAAKAEAEPESTAAAKAPPKADVKPEPKAGAKADPGTDAKSNGKAGAATVHAQVAAEPATAPPSAETAPAEPAVGAAVPAAAATPAAERAKVEGFIVQLGAFTDAYGANALAGKLRKAGYPAYTESVDTSRGTLWRVRVGGYPSRAAAIEARNRLKADGQNGIVSAAK
jgi:DedD protein